MTGSIQPQRVIMLGIVGLLTSIALVFAQADEQWKKQNDRENRYEGRIGVPVGNPPLELLSFMGNSTPFPSGNPPKVLTISFFLPNSKYAFVSARELEEKKQYWMQVKQTDDWTPLAWNYFTPWPTEVVLLKEDIPLSNLGITVRVDKEKTNHLAPAILSFGKTPVSITSYTLYLRPGGTLNRVDYLLSDKNGVEIRSAPLLGVKLAGVPFSLKLDVEGLPEGQTHLKITGAYKNRDGGPVEEYEFYHKIRIE